MRKIILMLGLLSGMAQANPIEVQELSTEYRNTNCGESCNFRHAFIEPERELKYSILQDTKITVYDYILLENRFFFDGSDKVEYAGLEYRVGLQFPVKKDYSVSVGKWHHSSHVMDREVRGGEFPLVDAIYVKINWIQKR